jgi:hypothetical protein
VQGGTHGRVHGWAHDGGARPADNTMFAAVQLVLSLQLWPWCCGRSTAAFRLCHPPSTVLVQRHSLLYRTCTSTTNGSCRKADASIHHQSVHNQLNKQSTRRPHLNNVWSNMRSRLVEG